MIDFPEESLEEFLEESLEERNRQMLEVLDESLMEFLEKSLKTSKFFRKSGQAFLYRIETSFTVIKIFLPRITSKSYAGVCLMFPSGTAPKISSGIHLSNV